MRQSQHRKKMLHADNEWPQKMFGFVNFGFVFELFGSESLCQCMSKQINVDHSVGFYLQWWKKGNFPDAQMNCNIFIELGRDEPN